MRRCGSASESGIPSGETATAPDKTNRTAKSDPAAVGGYRTRRRGFFPDHTYGLPHSSTSARFLDFHITWEKCTRAARGRLQVNPAAGRLPSASSADSILPCGHAVQPGQTLAGLLLECELQKGRHRP